MTKYTLAAFILALSVTAASLVAFAGNYTVAFESLEGCRAPRVSVAKAPQGPATLAPKTGAGEYGFYLVAPYTASLILFVAGIIVAVRGLSLRRAESGRLARYLAAVKSAYYVGLSGVLLGLSVAIAGVARGQASLALAGLAALIVNALVYVRARAGLENAERLLFRSGA